MHNDVVYPSLKKVVRNGWVEQKSMQGDRGQQQSFLGRHASVVVLAVHPTPQHQVVVRLRA